jgi:structural maintenance of chromosomes protein 5
VTTWFRAYQDNLLIPPPMSPEEVRQKLCHFLLPALTFFVSQMANLRFDGYAIEYVDYPTGMEWFLKRDINLHRTVKSPVILKLIPVL